MVFRFTEEEMWGFLAQLALALEYIHHEGIVHRDLKSENVFICDKVFLRVGFVLELSIHPFTFFFES